MSECELRFHALNQKLTAMPTLTLTDIWQDFVIYCDAWSQSLPRFETCNYGAWTQNMEALCDQELTSVTSTPITRA
jgi:hypothetical protein